MTQALFRTKGENVSFTGSPGPTVTDALIRHGYRFDDRSGQWWRPAADGHIFTAEQFADWLDGQTPPACDGERHQYRFQSYYTPEPVADRVAFLADLKPGLACLEPSAGHGAIARVLDREGGAVTCVEADPTAAHHLRLDGFHTIEGDFLRVQPGVIGQFDRIVMNPPFSRDQDCRHVSHAFGFLKPGGKLIAVVGSYALSGKGSAARDDLRALVARHGRVVEDLPAGTFANAARSVIIELHN